MKINSILFLFVFGLSAQAATQPTGGDSILMIEGGSQKVFLNELVQSGDHLAPFINPNQKINFGVEQIVKNNLPQNIFDTKADRENVEALLINKLSRLSEKSVLAYFVGRILGEYQYSLVYSNLSDTNDEYAKTDKAGVLKQVAVRNQNQILINKLLWTKMNPAHKAALLMHEMLYALSKPETGYTNQTADACLEQLNSSIEKTFASSSSSFRKFKLDESINQGSCQILNVAAQNSKAARNLVAYLFSEEMPEQFLEKALQNFDYYSGFDIESNYQYPNFISKIQYLPQLNSIETGSRIKIEFGSNTITVEKNIEYSEMAELAASTCTKIKQSKADDLKINLIKTSFQPKASSEYAIGQAFIEVEAPHNMVSLENSSAAYRGAFVTNDLMDADAFFNETSKVLLKKGVAGCFEQVFPALRKAFEAGF